MPTDASGWIFTHIEFYAVDSDMCHNNKQQTLMPFLCNNG